MTCDMMMGTRAMVRGCRAWWAVVAAFAGGVSAAGAVQPVDRGAPDRLLSRMTAFHTEVPAHPFDMVLVSPTPRSIEVSVVSYEDQEGRIEYWERGEKGERETAVQAMPSGRPVLFTLSGLRADCAYEYRVSHRATHAGQGGGAEGDSFVREETRRFHTPRAAGAAFTFTVIADSHLDSNMMPAVYERALANALDDGPDFHVDLGDTFMTDKRGKDFRSAQPQYVAQRYYMGSLCHSAPLFMVLGNHDGEWGYANRGEESMARWSFEQRTAYFPPPEIGEDAGAMYTGRTSYAKGQGGAYYAFAWGDATIVVLDPFWCTTEKMRGPGGRGGGKEVVGETTLTDAGWTMTLGREQYDWLTRTLEASRGGQTFVFIHHLVGGLGRASRGGAEAAQYFEWGGKNADGTEGFLEHRPGWAMPIHQLLVKHRVACVFHGHDHLYVHEQRDGVVYQCVPQPGNVNGGTRSADEYGYHQGTILGSPGHVRVRVSAEKATVELVRAAVGAEAGAKGWEGYVNGAVADSYVISRGE